MLRFIGTAGSLLVVAAMSATQAGAEIPDQAILAALQGPEGQYKVSVPEGKKHRYKPRPGSYWVDGDRVVFECKLTHVLRFGDPDGQIEIRVDREGLEPPKVTFTRWKKGGIGAKTAEKILDALNKAPKTGKAPLDIAVEVLKSIRPLLTLDHGDWDVAGVALAHAIADRVSAEQARQVIGPHTPGITVYRHHERTGNAAFFPVGQNVPDLGKVKLNDRVTSFVANVPEGYVLTLYVDKYSGNKLELSPGLHYYQNMGYVLKDMNDKLTSLRWRKQTELERGLAPLAGALFGAN